MMKVKVLFVDGSGIEDREEVVPAGNKEDAVLLAATRLTFHEALHLFTLEAIV